MSEPRPILDYHRDDTCRKTWAEFLRAAWFLLWFTSLMVVIALAIGRLLRLFA